MVPLPDVVRAIAPTDILPRMGQSQSLTGLRLLRDNNLRRVKPVTAVAYESLHQVYVLEPGLGLVPHTEVHHIHTCFLSLFHLPSSDLLGMSLVVLSGRINPVAVMRACDPASFHYDRNLEIPFGGERFLPLLVISCHPEGIVTETVTF